MSGDAFARRLKELRGATTRARAALVADELSSMTHLADAAERAEYLAVLADRGMTPPALSPIRLGPGESWLLLHEPPDRGRVVRIAARRSAGRAGVHRLPAEEIHRAYRGTSSTVARECRRLPWGGVPPEIDVQLAPEVVRVEGSSLGVSLAVVFVAAALGVAADHRVAGSAVVFDDGGLGSVEHLPSKLAALRRSRPEVERIVVARNQALPQMHDCPIEVVRAASVAEALPIFGLDVKKLGAAPIEEHRARVARLQEENSRAHDPHRWLALANEAWESACALEEEEPDVSARSMLLAAHFALHAGEPDAARLFARGVPASIARELPAVMAQKIIIEASTAIDADDLDGARRSAENAVRLCEALAGNERRDLLGQALGTHGRALMHAGAYSEAESLLRRAVEHHRGHRPAEEARSWCHLATCIRLAGRPEEALAITNAALEQSAARSAGRILAATTRLHLLLERGRSLAALGRWRPAVADFEAVCNEQHGDHAYPRLGALRSLAAALRTIENTHRSDRVLRECLAAAARLGDSPPHWTLSRVAAMAAGDALLDGAACGVPRTELEAAWKATFPDSTDRADIAATVARWVY